MDVQDSEQQKTALVVATQDGVDMRFNSREMALDLDNFSKLHLEPAMATLISTIEAKVLAACTKKVWNVAGTANSALNDLAAVGAARAKLNQGLAPKDNQRYVQIGSNAMATLVNGLKGLYQDSAQLKEQYREGFIARTAMADFYENERVWTMANGSDHTGKTAADAAVTDGGDSITYDSGGDAISVNVGEVFTVAGVYACHPETKQPYANLQQFVITALPGSQVMKVLPQIHLTGAKKNVCSATGGDLATTDFNAKVLTFVGDVDKSYEQELMYHKDAFTFATAELPIIGGADKCVTRTYDGISLRVWQDGDIRNDELLTRIDILYGSEAIRPQWACRIIGAANS